MQIHGQCHCGNLAFDLTTDKSDAEIEPRACACEFCRMHAAKAWSDPDGRVVISVASSVRLQRYEFALKTAEFFVCRECGGYLAAVLTDLDGCWSTVNLQLSSLRDRPASPVDYDTEQVNQRVTRRKDAWTPTEIIISA